ncbi:hypothetical protein ACFLTM_01565 [Candidatus Bipolaricaulota bacterium]
MPTLVAALCIIAVALLISGIRSRTSTRGRSARQPQRIYDWIDREICDMRTRISEGEIRHRIDRRDSPIRLSPGYIYLLLQRGEVDHVAEVISRQFGLKFKTVSVEFDPEIQQRSCSVHRAAGLVEVSDTWDGIYADIHIDSRYRSSPEQVGAILAHELAHVLLTTLDIYGDGLEIERRTDLAGYVCGMGKLALNGFQGASRLGYLEGQEMAYSYASVCQYDHITFEDAVDGLCESAKHLLASYQRSWEHNSR